MLLLALSPGALPLFPLHTRLCVELVAFIPSPMGCFVDTSAGICRYMHVAREGVQADINRNCAKRSEVYGHSWGKKTVPIYNILWLGFLGRLMELGGAGRFEKGISLGTEKGLRYKLHGTNSCLLGVAVADVSCHQIPDSKLYNRD